MASFQFAVETKHTIWYKSFVNIDADSLEEAIKKVRAVGASGLEEDNYYSEMMLDTLGYLSVDDNGGQPTEEIRCLENSEIIWDNVAFPNTQQGVTQ